MQTPQTPQKKGVPLARMFGRSLGQFLGSLSLLMWAGSPVAHGALSAQAQERLSAHSAEHKALNKQPSAQNFLNQHERWQFRWSAETGQLLQAFGDGFPLCPPKAGLNAMEHCGKNFVEQHPELFLQEGLSLKKRSAQTWQNRSYLSYQKLFLGIPILGATVELRLQDGLLTSLYGQDLALPSLTPSPTPSLKAEMAWKHLPPGARPLGEAELYWSSIAGEKTGNLQLVWLLQWAPSRGIEGYKTLVDAHSGEILEQVNTTHTAITGLATAEREDRQEGGSRSVAPLPYVEITLDDEASVVSNLEGHFESSREVVNKASLSLQGPYLSVYDELLEGIPQKSVTLDEATSLEILWQNEEVSLIARSTYVAVSEARAFLQSLRPDLPWLEQQIPVSVNGDNDRGDSCNAYFSPDEGLFFLVGNEGCANFARLKDVVYHEYGHGVHHAVRLAGDFDGAISEGSADYFAATQTDDPIIGLEAYGPGSYIRDLRTLRRLPDDLSGQVHSDGLIWGGALWDLRNLLIERDGESEGKALADELLLGTLASGPTLWDVYFALLFADDDDADLSNGTPNICEIQGALGPHGLGDGNLGLFDWGHTPLADQGGDESGYTISATPSILSSDCSEIDFDSLTLYYQVNGGPWLPMAMETELRGKSYTATLPPAPPGSTIRYDLQVWDTSLNDWATYSQGRTDLAPEFYVGPLENIWCDDFESAGDWLAEPSAEAGGDWEYGEPYGHGGDPSSAASGARIWGTNLGHNSDGGNYQGDLRQSLTSPSINTLGHHQIRLNYWRSLSVEDGQYDEAAILVDGDIQWKNLETDLGLYHHFDAGWYRHTLPIWTLADRDEAAISFRLNSDEAINFGGWNIDDVCLQAPTDLPERYRAPLSLETQDKSNLLRAQLPWAHPIKAVQILRKPAQIPQDPSDGDSIYFSEELGALEALVFEDQWLTQGENYGYRLFIFDGTMWWPQDPPQPGEGVLMVDEDEPTPTPNPSPTKTQEVDEEEAGCSCKAGPKSAPGFHLLWGILFLAIRPRRAGALK